MATEYELGLLVGLLIGEGHFGGDGRQPQITLRMHVRHEALFNWLEATFPGGRLYGPYDHSGRRYYQWMARGSYLRDELLPLIESRITPDLDGHAFLRFVEMRRRYEPQLSRRKSAPDPRVPAAPGVDLSNPNEEPASDVVGSPHAGLEGASAAQPEPSPESILSRAESIFSRMRDSDSK
jgi:hypothetical protein